MLSPAAWAAGSDKARSSRGGSKGTGEAVGADNRINTTPPHRPYKRVEIPADVARKLARAARVAEAAALGVDFSENRHAEPAEEEEADVGW